RQLNPKTANSETFPPYGGKVSEFRKNYFLKVCLTFWGQVRKGMCGLWFLRLSRQSGASGGCLNCTA
ncbi:MAG: hypothetical protein LBM59_03590, partial [Ruminococcus sp.]|nr:hypothetical protein [Ruminococcus sp.]